MIDSIGASRVLPASREVVPAQRVPQGEGHPLLPSRATCTLASERLRATLVPSSGGRIASLVHRRSGREWMWAPPGGQLRDRGPSNNFADSPMVGADDCLPTVGACTIDGVEYADHGEVWQQPWSVRNYDLPRSCTMAVELDTHGIRMERHATADGSCLRLEYSVDRTRPTTLPWLWSWHPLFVVPMLPRLEVEGVIGTPRVESCHGVSTSDTRLSLPAACDHSAVRTLDLGGQNRSAKLFLDAENEGAATLHDDANGAFLRVSWKGEALRGLGLWINRGGWNGYHHVAVEPCTAPVESPADLCDPSDCPESAKWTIEVELG